MLAAKVEAVREAVDLERDSFFERNFKHALQVQGVLRPPVDVAALRMAETTHVGVAQRLLDALRQLPSRHSLTAVHARLYPLELREDVVGKIEPSVGEDVALDPAQDPEWREQFVRSRNLLGLAADIVGGEPA